MLRLANEDASKSRFRILAWLSQIPFQPLSWLWLQCLLRKVASKIVQSIGWTQPSSALIWRLSLNFKAAGMILNSISLLHKVPLKQYQVDLHRHTKAFLQVPHNLLHWKQDMFQCIQTSVLQKSHKHFTFIPKKLNKCNQHTLPQFSTCSQKKTKFKSSALMRVAAQQPARPVTIRSTARTKDMASTGVMENGFPNQTTKKKLQKQVLFIQVGEVQGFILVWAHM